VRADPVDPGSASFASRAGSVKRVRWYLQGATPGAFSRRRQHGQIAEARVPQPGGLPGFGSLRYLALAVGASPGNWQAQTLSADLGTNADQRREAATLPGSCAATARLSVRPASLYLERTVVCLRKNGCKQKLNDAPFRCRSPSKPRRG